MYQNYYSMHQTKLSKYPTELSMPPYINYGVIGGVLGGTIGAAGGVD